MEKNGTLSFYLYLLLSHLFWEKPYEIGELNTQIDTGDTAWMLVASAFVLL
ncbi:hypothetical protein [Nonlabens sp. MIC269]|uniref:hypothetical protein n=1 Tax=Nonlabens sp. MIC269 TaxID=1476901 RepID=UPI000AB0BB6E|nr:hypothetical protein [Nonlabens sp. MIC269]